MIFPAGIRAVLFDLDGTLRLNRPAFLELFFRNAARLGVHVSPANRLKLARWQHRYWAQSPEMLTDLQTYDGLSDVFWIHYACLELEEAGCPAEQSAVLAPEIHRLAREDGATENWVPPDVPTTLLALKEAGYTLGVVSNRSLPYDEELQTLGLAGYFEFVVAAGPLNSWKPEPGIFHHALHCAAARPEEAVYVGDNYFADIVGAQGAGLHAVLLDPEGIFPEAECPVIRSIGELAG